MTDFLRMKDTARVRLSQCSYTSCGIAFLARQVSRFFVCSAGHIAEILVRRVERRQELLVAGAGLQAVREVGQAGRVGGTGEGVFHVGLHLVLGGFGTAAQALDPRSSLSYRYTGSRVACEASAAPSSVPASVYPIRSWRCPVSLMESLFF